MFYAKRYAGFRLNKRKHPERRKTRWSAYDYSSPAWYFVTICTGKMQEFFGKVINEKMFLNELGKITEKCWNEIPNHYPNVELDYYVIMPNHVHGIVIIKTVGNEDIRSSQNPNNENIGNENIRSPQTPNNKNIGNENIRSPQTPNNKNIGNEDIRTPQTPNNENVGNENIRSLHKTNLSNVIKGFKIGVTKLCKQNNYYFKWQKSFYDRIIRNERELYNIRKYIQQNPLKWDLEKGIENLEI
ncbi:MAG: hypothetical protein PVH88_22740 [Ignavibacteria bacterium]|jgi:REP element-mobilizing transposase RayT